MVTSKKVELTANKPIIVKNQPPDQSLKIETYIYSGIEKSAIIHFNNDYRYTLTE